MKRVVRVDALVLSVALAFSVMFFLGIFINGPARSEYDVDSHYLIGRGYPIAWAGWSALDKHVTFPTVKAPFLVRTTYGDDTLFAKIIDLKLFIPYFLLAVILIYPIPYVFARASDENQRFKKLMRVFFVLALIGCWFFYFKWFPRL